MSEIRVFIYGPQVANTVISCMKYNAYFPLMIANSRKSTLSPRLGDISVVMKQIRNDHVISGVGAQRSCTRGGDDGV